MSENVKELQEIKREVIEARNLVIKNDNLLKNLHADLKTVAKKQETFEKRSFVSTATALILFASLASMGAYMFAKSEIASRDRELEEAISAREHAEQVQEKIEAQAQEAKTESEEAFRLFEKLASEVEEERWEAVATVRELEPNHLSPLELGALRERSLALRINAASTALEAGRTAYNRRDYRVANDEFERYFELAPEADDVAYLLQGQARHQLRDYQGAIEPLEKFLSQAPDSRSADYVTLLLGESYSESGNAEKAIEIYLEGANKFRNSQWSTAMRTRARRLQSR